MEKEIELNEINFKNLLEMAHIAAELICAIKRNKYPVAHLRMLEFESYYSEVFNTSVFPPGEKVLGKL